MNEVNQKFVTCTPAQAASEIRAIDKLIEGIATRIERANKYTRFNTSANLGRAVDSLRKARMMYEQRAAQASLPE